MFERKTPQNDKVGVCVLQSGQVLGMISKLQVNAKRL